MGQEKSDQKSSKQRKRPSNGQRRLAITLTVGSLAASFWGAQMLASAYEADLVEETDLSQAEPVSITTREPYTLDLQPLPTVALSDQERSADLQFDTFSLELEPVPTVAAPEIEVPTNVKGKSSK